MGSKRDVAFVTGASAGIGEAFAERLARDGYDLIITARREERLRSLAERLSKETEVSVEVLPADLSASNDLRALERRVAAEDRLALLVNNAGFGAYRHFVSLEPDVAENLIDVHVTASVRLSRAALPGMVSRGRGAIVNVASMLAFSGTLPPAPLPARATYAGAKAFLVTFTQTLAGELAGTGVKAQVCCPGLVATEFHEVQGQDMSSLPRMSPDEVVRASLAGLDAGEVVCCPTLEDASALDRLAEAQIAVLGYGQGPPSVELASRYRG
jgi:uncharacterized protein